MTALDDFPADIRDDVRGGGVTCGGCTSGGAHRRWCPAVVGEVSARRARMAEQADALGDSCGVPEAAWHLWAAASVLRAEADRLARAYAAHHSTT